MYTTQLLVFPLLLLTNTRDVRCMQIIYKGVFKMKRKGHCYVTFDTLAESHLL